jgi:beta-glucosidase
VGEKIPSLESLSRDSGRLGVGCRFRKIVKNKLYRNMRTRSKIFRDSSALFMLMVVNQFVIGQQTYEFPYQNPELSVELRVNDLVGRMTVEEKISQMMNGAPAIERLGIPAYNWWNECLHGVARAGVATVFPQAIGLGATWDEDLIFRVSTVISDEARAKHHEFVRNGSRRIYQGLTFWSPNINIFRDPRWGRGQETYGEDPFLTGKLAVQFVKGLQGDDPKYFKTIATLKHFAVHSGPEPERHSFDAVTDERDFRDTYLPQFEMGIKEGKAYSVMCAYNRYNGETCCGSNSLLTGILRTEWGFEGYVVSDCGAIDDIFRGHKVVATSAEAAALGVRSGTELECGSVYRNLKESLNKGLITEVEIDAAMKKLFTARFRLGMFDPPEMVEYSKIPYTVLDSEPSKALARETALKSIVLLKNENNLLPLKKNIGTVAVIGPNADQTFVLLGNYNGTPSDPVTPLRGIKEKLNGLAEVLYAQGCNWVAGIPNQKPDEELKSEALEVAKKASVVIMCMGITPRLEGEQLKVNVEGFLGGDRTRLDLPDVQQKLIKEVHALGKPVILVLLNGSALAVNWENENIPAIIETWYGGQAAGQALADVIFGDYNPGGRLPVTVYKSVNDLPDFREYKMDNRTYRYFKGEPLYPFGYGLSYTTFKYSKLKVAKICNAGDTVKVTVKVQNTGKLAGDEVAQLYISNLTASVPVPLRALKGFKRIYLNPGESKIVTFMVTPDAFSVIDENNKRVVKAGKFMVSAGGHQPSNRTIDAEQGIVKKMISVL